MVIVIFAFLLVLFLLYTIYCYRKRKSKSYPRTCSFFSKHISSLYPQSPLHTLVYYSFSLPIPSDFLLSTVPSLPASLCSKTDCAIISRLLLPAYLHPLSSKQPFHKIFPENTFLALSPKSLEIPYLSTHHSVLE